MSTSVPRKSFVSAGVASALGLLAETAHSAVVSFTPGSPIASGLTNVPAVCWDPMANSATGGFALDVMSLGNPLCVYACYGSMNLNAGTSETNIGILGDGISTAFRLSPGDIVPTNGLYHWSSGPGWLGYIVTNESFNDEHFFIGYQVQLNGASGTNYGYAELSYFTNGNVATERLTLYHWAYETTPETSIMVVPEPGAGLFLLCGILIAGLGLFRRRLSFLRRMHG